MMIFNKFGAWLLAALAIAASFYAAIKSASSVGKAEAKAEADKKQAEVIKQAAKIENETLKEATNVQANINTLDDGDAAKQLRDKWQRD
jgi:uncharacterized protein (UPF0333 family)